MKFDKAIKRKEYKELWDQYCGFLDINVDQMMQIQNRLLMEQIELMNNSVLGKKIFKNGCPKNVSEFRSLVDLSTYDFYADTLLTHREKDLSLDVVTWIETTWEGGRHPIKTAPYTKPMLDTFKNNTLACLMLASSKGRYDFKIRPHDNTLYGVASLPYATGLLPLLLEDEITLNVLPDVKSAQQMSFKERNIKGFKLGMQNGLDTFFALSAVAYYISTALNDASSSSKGSIKMLMKAQPKMAYRMIKSKYKCKKENRQLLPKDLFNMKALICAGTDSRYYKEKLEKMWGLVPSEIFAGTEPTCIASESWAKNGMYFFPDACFYEFMPESEMYKRIKDSKYKAKTYLINEVAINETYELVITVFKGGAFARYLTGDCYRCINLEDRENNIKLPRFEFVDRIPTIIDIAGFTRISEKSIQDVINISKLSIDNWVALKEYDEDWRPFMHLIVEIKTDALGSDAIDMKLLKAHLQAYFTYFDSDYDDLQKMLGIDPLKITVLKCGTFERYQKEYGKPITKMNEKGYIIKDLIALSNSNGGQV